VRAGDTKLASLGEIQEEHGNHVAKKAVIAVARRLRRASRTIDLLGYLGDGRFGTVLLNCSEGERLQFIRRLPAELELSMAKGSPLVLKLAVFAGQHDGSASEPMAFIRQVERSAAITETVIATVG